MPLYRAYIQLIKPGVISLVGFTSLVSAVIAPYSGPWYIPIYVCLCVLMNAAGAAAYNMWYESESDGLMERTAHRPLPQKDLSRQDAQRFAFSLTVFSLLWMCFLSGYIAALYLLATHFFYAYIYTVWLKPRTPYNIVIGGISGALPPLVTWYALMHRIDIYPLYMVLIIFLWTPPHFWALALARQEEYARSPFPMFPERFGVARTEQAIWRYSCALCFGAFTLYIHGMASHVYAIGALFLSVWLLYRAYWLSVTKKYMAFFGLSIVYLFALFLCMLLDNYFSL